ncbi:MAG: class I SAM-dependent methyltransferase [Chloroflexi bacterium]|nr:class I SAM-dependent methyltransferase [Chloroflexota bacterium]MDA1173335.1 class I SAM-dependent methyltransferase [Chloroflexota bacterium]
MTQLHPITECCSTLYGHPLAAFLMGDSFHPGGLGLTLELARAAGVSHGQRVLDAGSGRGVSSVFLGETLGCRVTGLTIEAAGVAEGEAHATAQGVSERVAFVQGDIMDMPANLTAFDTVVMECVLSTLPNKHEALLRIRDVLKPGGTLAITDVTREGEVPEELEGVTAAALCLAGAISLIGYARAIEDAGFAVEEARDLPDTVGGFIDKARNGLMLAEIAVGLGKLDVPATTLEPAKRAVKAARGLASDGRLGYALLVARALTAT